jgi:hypothetical protein
MSHADDDVDRVGAPHHPAARTTAIALWNVVARQEVTDRLEVGVVAAHMHGIDRVEISLEGGKPVVLTQASRNPRTRQHEYWTVFDPDTVPDGPVTLRAIAYPTVGWPRVIDIDLIANARGSLVSGTTTIGPKGDHPTLREAIEAVEALHGSAEGHTFELLPGTHEYPDLWAMPSPDADRRYMTITGPRPGRGSATLRIERRKGIGGHLRFRHVTLDLDYDAQIYAGGKFNGNPWRLWLDEGTRVIGDVDRPFKGYVGRGVFAGGVWFTGAVVQGIQKGFDGVLVRDCVGLDIGEDAFHNPALVLNTRILRVDRKQTDMHPDVFYWNNRPVDNVFIRDVDVRQADSQGLMLTGAMRNIAIINVDITEHTGGGARVFRGFGELSHVYIKGGRYDGPCEFRNPDLENFVLEGVVFGRKAPFLPHSTPRDGVILRGYAIGD